MLSPVAGALLCLLVRGRRPATVISSVSTSVSLAMLLAAALPVVSGGAYVERYPWPPLQTAGLRLDGLSVTFALVIAAVSVAVSVYSSTYMQARFGSMGRERWSAYYFLMLTFVSGMLGTVLATNIIEFYIFFEAMLIPSYFLIAEFGHGGRDGASFSYFMWTHIGALVMLAGLIALVYSTDTLSISAAASRAGFVPGVVQLFIAAAITGGLMVKMAGFGLHAWLPAAYTEAPAPVSALLSSSMSGIAGYAIIRLVALSLPTGFSYVAPWLLVWGAVSLAYGGLMALAQDDFKLLLSYSSISQMGYMAVGIGSFTSFGMAGAVALYAANGFGKAALFMAAGILSVALGRRSMSTMGGLAGRLPRTSTFSLIAFLTMMGVPPTVGFVAEFFIFQGAFASAVAAGSGTMLAVAFVALLGTMLTAAYSLLSVKKVFFGPLAAENGQVSEAPAKLVLPMAALCVASVALGILPVLFGASLSFIRLVLGGS